MSETVIANNGTRLPLDDLPITIAYNTDGTVDSLTVVYNSVSYVQTFGYTNGLVTSISNWQAAA